MAAAQNVTSWATWVVPTEYPYAAPYRYAVGTIGTVVDPVDGREIDLTISGEVNIETSARKTWHSSTGVNPYISEISPTLLNPPGQSGVSMIGATGFVSDGNPVTTLRFEEEVSNAVMAFYNLGRRGVNTVLKFSQPFDILGDATGFVSGGDENTGYTLVGRERSGVIQFLGTLDRIDWVVTNNPEYYFGYTVGLTTPDNRLAGVDVATVNLFAEGTGFTEPPDIAPFPKPEQLSVSQDPVPEQPLSVLERVLAQIDSASNLAPITGTFANIAENIGAVDGTGIDGSIDNVLGGVIVGTEAALALSSLSGTEFSLLSTDIGSMGTTVLGAVNTGDINLSVNAAVDDAQGRLAHATTATMIQLGGTTTSGALVLNVASNMTGINGAIRNTVTGINLGVGDASTTALGAVNTGAIMSGVDAAVQGIVGSSG
jgi:hypothetical protein